VNRGDGSPSNSLSVEPMQIRPATPVDSPAVHELVQRAYTPYVSLSRIGRQPGPMTDDYLAKVEQGHVSVAVEGTALWA